MEEYLTLAVKLPVSQAVADLVANVIAKSNNGDKLTTAEELVLMSAVKGVLGKS